MCSVDFLTLTLKLPIQTSLSLVSKLTVSLHSTKNFVENVLGSFFTLTLKLPIQTSLSVVPKLHYVQVKNVKNSGIRAYPWA